MLSILLLFTALRAPTAPVQPISAQQFSTGIRPEPVRRPRSYTASRTGVQVGSCPLLRSNYADEQYTKYAMLGSFSSLPGYVFVTETYYNGFAVVALSTKTCQQAKLTGHPFVLGSLVCCFEERETTDRQDHISVWRLLPNGRLMLQKTIPLPKDRAFYNDYAQVRYSTDRTSIYYQVVGGSYMACRLQ